MARNDGKPMGIAELRKRWPDQHAIGAMIKVPDGGYVSLSTDLPPDLAREIMGKLSWHIGGHDWKRWTPDQWVAPVVPCTCGYERGNPGHPCSFCKDPKKHHSFSGGNSNEPKT